MKMSEIRESKGKGGEYYGLDDILGEEITILENLSQDSDVREYKTKKDNVYCCVLIRHMAEKDLHLTRAAMKALAEAMPQNPTESWKGYRIRINRTGTGFATAYKIVVVGKSFDSPLPTTPSAPITDSAGKLLETLKHAPAGMEDKAFWDMAFAVCGGLGDAMAVAGKLKNEGKIVQVNGVWKAV